MRATVLTLGILLVSVAASATITFDQLDDDLFVISHRVKVIGSRGQAMRLVYEKAASVCLAAGFSHFRILNQESAAGQQHEAANASIQAQYFFADGEGRIDCERNASAEYVEQARKKLAKRGYVPMEPPAGAVPAAGGEAGGSAGTSCTVEQITAMVQLGLSADQIRAACPSGS